MTPSLLSALAWTLKSVPDHPPDAGMQGWTGHMLREWQDNLEACRRILEAAARGQVYAALPVDAENFEGTIEEAGK